MLANQAEKLGVELSYPRPECFPEQSGKSRRGCFHDQIWARSSGTAKPIPMQLAASMSTRN
jgi:hypothetical protein